MFKVKAEGTKNPILAESDIYRIPGTGMGFSATTRGRRGNPIAAAQGRRGR